MKKEILWAGVIGIAFGLVIGFGVWRVKTSMNKQQALRPTPTPQANGERTKIAINQPENYDVITENSVEITGITKPKNWIVISTEEHDYLGESSDDGTFSIKIELTSGVNNIIVNSVNRQGIVSSEKLLIVYSSSFQTVQNSPEASTKSANTNDLVANKIAKAQMQPKSYIGTVTDIADSTIQIKNSESQIQQIATNKLDISVINTKGSTSKTVKLTDIGIGDFIVSMGYVDGNEVLDAQRILISEPSTNTKITTALYKVSVVGKKTITLSSISGNDPLDITPDKNTDLISYINKATKNISISGIQASDVVLLVRDETGTPFITRSVFDTGKQE